MREKQEEEELLHLNTALLFPAFIFTLHNIYQRGGKLVSRNEHNDDDDDDFSGRRISLQRPHTSEKDHQVWRATNSKTCCQRRENTNTNTNEKIIMCVH